MIGIGVGAIAVAASVKTRLVLPIWWYVPEAGVKLRYLRWKMMIWVLLRNHPQSHRRSWIAVPPPPPSMVKKHNSNDDTFVELNSLSLRLLVLLFWGREEVRGVESRRQFCSVCYLSYPGRECLRYVLFDNHFSHRRRKRWLGSEGRKPRLPTRPWLLQRLQTTSVRLCKPFLSHHPMIDKSRFVVVGREKWGDTIVCEHQQGGRLVRCIVVQFKGFVLAHGIGKSCSWIS